jgi:hypothetical protein
VSDLVEEVEPGQPHALLFLYRVIKKEVYTFKNVILQKLLALNPCPVYEWKGNLSKF